MERREFTDLYYDLHLPEGYFAYYDPDVLYLYRTNRTLVARFSAQGAQPEEITRAAWEDVIGGEEKGS